MQNNICTNKNKYTNGFTIIELLLVIMIAGAILALVVPRAYRANVESKYTLLRQVCIELASNANKWAEQQVELQPTSIDDTPVTSNIRNYMNSLAGVTAGNPVWLAVPNASNWDNTLIGVAGRGTSGTPPISSVLQMMPPDNHPKNPFNGASVFVAANNPGTLGLTPGAIACGWAVDAVTGLNYYALIFLGTGSATITDYHAGQGPAIVGLRNGVFINRL